jgi:tellurite resistance protein TerC
LENLLSSPFMGQELWMWLVFTAVVLVLLIIDLGFLHKDQHEIDVRESFILSGGYITVSILFGFWIWHVLGQDSGLDFLTGYVIEKSLSVDNLFVMSIIFAAFYIPRKYQHRVLFWGIIGVVVLRGIMIFLGAALVHHFEFILYIFAAFLIFTGIKLLLMKDEGDHGKDVQANPIVSYISNRFHVAPLEGQKFIVKHLDPKTGKMVWAITPLLLALITIELADVVFAIDSVPAIFAITTDPYIVYTSNIFAILGLRALYFALSAMIERFAYLKYAISVILIFIGAKVFITPLLGLEKFPASISLSVTLGLLTVGIIYSLYKTKNSQTSY